MRLIPTVLLALLLLPSAGQAQASESLRIFGFFSTELEGDDRGPSSDAWTFDQHYFNIVTVFTINDHWRAFGETEWEHGPGLSGSGGSGVVALERGWLEYHRSDALQVKVGKFLPPFGIYNRRHDATPSYLMTELPGSVYGKHANTTGTSQRLYPKFGTGLQVLGRLFSDQGSLEYFAYVVNGRGASPGSEDDNSDKGVGGRAVLSSAADEMKLGVSFYTDRNGLAANTRQTTVAADARIAFGPTWVDWEVMIPWLETLDATGAPSGQSREGMGFYVQGSRLMWDRLTPFFRFESYDPDTQARQDREWAVVSGLNLALDPRVFLKGEVHSRHFIDPTRPAYRFFAFSLAAAF